MKAISLKEPGHFETIEIEEPAKPVDGEALVRVHNMGICGTDYSGYLGKMPFFSYPRIPGHELGVEVLEVGPGVTNIKPGDRCSIEPYINCQECFACRRGFSNCCEKLEVLGVHKDGGLRPQFVLPARKLHPSKKLEPEQLALVETLAIGCHAVDRGNPQPGDNILVIGAGPIGLSVIEFAKIADARITVLDMIEKRLDFCKNTMGVEHTIQFKGDGSEMDQLLQVTGGDRATLVIDATGNPQSMSGALNFVAHSGTLVYLGITTKEVSFLHTTLHKPEMNLLASRNALPKDFGRIIQLIEDGKIDTDPWITHRTSFDEMIHDFETFIKPETGVIKAMIAID